MVETKDKSIKILFNTIKYFYFLDSATFRSQGKKCEIFRWFFGVWVGKIICFRDLLTFIVLGSQNRHFLKGLQLLKISLKVDKSESLLIFSSQKHKYLPKFVCVLTIYYVSFLLFVKVHILWGGHKIWKTLQISFDVTNTVKTEWKIFSIFGGPSQNI